MTAETAATKTGKATLLVVESERPHRETLAAGLRDHGYAVLAAGSGDEALTLAANQSVDLALLAVQAEDTSGIALADALRQRSALASIFFSLCGDAEPVRRAGEHGPLVRLVEPIDASRLLPAVEAGLLRGRELGDLRRAQASMTAELAGAREISVATGILIERIHVDRAHAFELLRRHARSQRRKLREVAADIVQAAEALNIPR